MPAPVLRRHAFLQRLGGRRGAAAALADGSWRRVLRGTYAPGGAELDLELRCRAAQLLLPEHARVADRCLLWLLGVDVLPPGPPLLEVVVPRGTVVPRRSWVRARTADIPLRDKAWISSSRVRCLRPVRASADLLRRLPLADAVVVADAVQYAGLVDADALSDELVHHVGLRGVRSARRAWEFSDRLAESPPESRVRLALVLAGLAPVCQHVVTDSRGAFVARVDLAFPEHRVAIEYDGWAVHQQGDAFRRDRQRQNALVMAGWTVLRFTAEDLRRLEVVVRQVRAALAQHRAA